MQHAQTYVVCGLRVYGCVLRVYGAAHADGARVGDAQQTGRSHARPCTHKSSVRGVCEVEPFVEVCVEVALFRR